MGLSIQECLVLHFLEYSTTPFIFSCTQFSSSAHKKRLLQEFLVLSHCDAHSCLQTRLQGDLIAKHLFAWRVEDPDTCSYQEKCAV